MPDMTPRLTTAAQKNLARGATSGAGTGICNRCAGPKEDRRLNSGRCAACDGTAPTKDARPVYLDSALYDRVSAAATERGVTVTEYVRGALSTGIDLSPAPPKKMTNGEWAALSDWLVERGEDPRRAGCSTKSEALAWARQNGYTS